MPLAFESSSHGIVSFGYFNIESDMLLLDRLFFFSPEFCDAAIHVISGECAHARPTIQAWRIEDRSRIGDLHAAIAGQDLSGFIGEIYERFPFPRSREDFRQDPLGDASRPFVESVISRYGAPVAIPVTEVDGTVHIGEYAFDGAGFDALVEYVIRGGMPTWKDGILPVCVERMKRVAARDITR